MTVRGAPAIAIVAALSLAVELQSLPQNNFVSAQEAVKFIVGKLNYLEGSRPTAVNLFEATAKLRSRVHNKLSDDNVSVEEIVKSYSDTAKQMLVDDVNDNRAIGGHGAEWIIKQNPS